MLAKLPVCGGDDIIDTFDFRKPDFAASCFILVLHDIRKVLFLPWWATVVIVASLSKSSRTRTQFIGSVSVTRSQEMSS